MCFTKSIRRDAFWWGVRRWQVIMANGLDDVPTSGYGLSQNLVTVIFVHFGIELDSGSCVVLQGGAS
jgi:hypothetical protein